MKRHRRRQHTSGGPPSSNHRRRRAHPVIQHSGGPDVEHHIEPLSAVAAKSATCPTDTQQQTCLNTLNGQLADATSAGLPLLWGTVADCTNPQTSCNWWDERGLTDPHGGSAGRLLLVLIGFALTITALVPGARFWFDLLSRLGSLRSSGPKPATST